MLLRFAGLSRAPSERTLSRSLKKLGYKSWPELDRLSTAVRDVRSMLAVSSELIDLATLEDWVRQRGIETEWREARESRHQASLIITCQPQLISNDRVN